MLTIDVTLPSSLVSVIRGTVVTADGTTPVDGATVAIGFTSGPCRSTNFSCTARTAPDGTFSITAAGGADGQVTVRAYWPHGDGVFVEKSLTATTQAGTVEAGVLTLPVTRVIGTVVAADGATPVAGARIEARYGSGPCSTAGACSTDAAANGTFSLQTAGGVEGGLTVRANSANNPSVFVEKSFSATTGPGIIDGGLFVLPISVVKGRVTRGGAAVPDPTVFATSANNVTHFADYTDANGNYLISGLQAGTYTLTAQDANTSLEASTTVRLATDGSTAVADLELPLTGTVEVLVFDRDGAPTDNVRVALTLPTGSFERYCGAFDPVQPTDGVCRFEVVPLGGYYAQAALRTCDQNGNCTSDGLASASGTLQDVDGTASLEVHFEQHNVLQLDLTDFEGAGVSETEPLDIEVMSGGSSGPLGAFASRGTYQLPLPDESGQRLLTLGEVPPGPVKITVRRTVDCPECGDPPTRIEVFAVAVSAVPPKAVETPHVVPVHAYSAASFWAWLSGDIQTGVSIPWFWVEDYGRATSGSGFVTKISDTSSEFGYSNAFDTAAATTVEGRQPQIGPGVPDGQFAPPSAGRFENGELIVGPFVTPRGTTLTRRLFTPADAGFLGYLDVYTNTTGVPVTLVVQQESRPYVGFSLSLVSSTTASEAQGASYVFRDPGANAAAWGEVVAGANALWRPTLAFTGENVPNAPLVASATQTLTIPANGRAALLHYLILRLPTDLQGVADQAQALMDLTAPNALAGLSNEDRALIVNFRIP